MKYHTVLKKKDYISHDDTIDHGFIEFMQSSNNFMLDRVVIESNSNEKLSKSSHGNGIKKIK